MKKIIIFLIIVALIIVGIKYYNMDQALEAALNVSKNIIHNNDYEE